MNENMIQVKTCDDLKNQPKEYKEAITKIVRSHAVNELYGARVFAVSYTHLTLPTIYSV